MSLTCISGGTHLHLWGGGEHFWYCIQGSQGYFGSQCCSHFIPPVCWSTFWRLTFKQQLGCKFDIMDCKSSLFHWYFDICNCICLNISYDFFCFIFTSWIVFFIFIKYSCSTIFHRRSLYSFYWNSKIVIFALREATKFLTLNVRGPSYLGLTRSISCLLMSWLLTSPGHQQPWYWLCRIGRFLSYVRKDFSYLRPINVVKWHKM